MNLTQLQKDILKKQISSIQKWRNEPKQTTFKIDDIEIIVSPKVFSPKLDSVLLAKKMRIKPGELVLDTCAGTGIQTIYASLVKKARMVYSCDINPFAVSNIKLNMQKYRLENKVKVFKTNLFPETKVLFDVIVANPPYTDYKSKDVIEKSVWDPKHKTLIGLLKNSHKYLKQIGRMYVSWANFADFSLFEKLVKANKFNCKKIASDKDPEDHRIEYRVYELTSSYLPR